MDKVELKDETERTAKRLTLNLEKNTLPKHLNNEIYRGEIKVTILTDVYLSPANGLLE